MSLPDEHAISFVVAVISNKFIRCFIILSAAGYISTERVIEGKKTRTLCRMTSKGKKAFEDYVDALKAYLNVKK